MHALRRLFSNRSNLTDLVSKLRNETALSIALCRRAALESNFNYNCALDILSKTTNILFKSNATEVVNFGKEGLIGIKGTSKQKCLIELRCDSDFVAQNSDFMTLTDYIMDYVINNDDFDASDTGVLNRLKEIKLSAYNNMTIQEIINLYRSKYRENIGIETIKVLQGDFLNGQVIGQYIHQKVGSNVNVGKIGALVKIQSKSNDKMEQLEELTNMLARQVVALGDKELNISSLLNSEYLFTSAGKVSDFIDEKESLLNSKISVLDLFYIKIK